MIAAALQQALKSENSKIVVEASNLASAEFYYVDLIFYLPMSRNLSESQKNAKLWHWESATSVPDLDNLEKFILDCGTGVLWQDDSSITGLRSRKFYSDNPRTEMLVAGKKRVKYPRFTEICMQVVSPGRLAEIARDARKLITFDLDDFLRLPDVKKEETVIQATEALYSFAISHADVIQKIHKKNKEPTSAPKHQ